jgi:deoxyribose-phosphate aldolase
MTTETPTSVAELARRIDHTLLKPEATSTEIQLLCDEALEHQFATVCVNPVWVEHARPKLTGSETQVCTVVGFPLGANATETKVDEARRALNDGALEVDMVVHVGGLVAGDRKFVTRDIAAVVDAVKTLSERAIVKVILETAALTEEQIVLGCRCTAEAQADYVKTSTGFHPAGGATVESVALLKKHAAPVKVKAAGGIRDLDTALAMIGAGADRIGASKSLAILNEMAARHGENAG